MEIIEKFCPVCKNKIERLATVCRYCGTAQENHHSDSLATFRNTTILEKDPATTADLQTHDSPIPDDSIAFYITGTLKPVYFRCDKDLVLGRGGDGPKGACLDLSELGGYEAGLSRKHAMIRKVEDGYEIVDLASTNGSWLNHERLTPNKPVPLPSKSQLRLGNMQILVMHTADSKIHKSA